LVAALATGVVGASGGKVSSADLSLSGLITPDVNTFLGKQNPGTIKPKAHVNWMLLDDQSP